MSEPVDTAATAAAAPAPAVRPGRRWVRVLLGLVTLGIAALWVYALFFASKEAVGRIDDRTWAERAEGICQTANERRSALADSRRIDDVGPNALTERAAIIDEATEIVEAMLDDIVKIAPAGPDDVSLVARWEAFYRQLIEDRRAYTDVLRAGANEPFRETAQEGAPISEWINDFTVVNEMTACSAPLDLSV